jgi:hypothetical protein
MRPHCDTVVLQSKRYNVFAVLLQLVETPRWRKTKILTKLTIQAEILWSCGDLREHLTMIFYIDSMEQVPMLEVGAVSGYTTWWRRSLVGGSVSLCWRVRWGTPTGPSTPGRGRT